MRSFHFAKLHVAVVCTLLAGIFFAPTALKVPVWDELVVPSRTEPKLRLAGLRVRPAPVPESVAGDGVFDALLVNDRLPETPPGANGPKPRLKVEL